VDIVTAEGPTITDALARPGKEIELAAPSVPRRLVVRLRTQHLSCWPAAGRA